MDTEKRPTTYELETSGKAPSTYRSFGAAVTFVVAVALLMVGGIVYNNGVFSSSSSDSTDSTDSTDSSTTTESSNLHFTLKSADYDALPYFDYSQDTLARYTHLNSHKAVIEPHKNMELHLYDSSSLDSDTRFVFEICHSDDTTACQEGEKYSTTLSDTVMFECSPFDTFTITMSRYSKSTGALLTTDSGTAICMYVRREIHDLTTDDLNKFLAAQKVMDEVDQDEGELLYGDAYYSTNTLKVLHFFNAASQDADHLHDGNGFLTQHVKIENIYETSLQLVDPSVSMPYWDFTVEYSAGETPADSSVLQTMYGTMGVPVDRMNGFGYRYDRIEDGRILDGLWKEQPVDENVIPGLQYGFGYMRAPWSLDPNPYIARYTFDFNGVTLPSCSSHYTMLTAYNDDMMSFMFGMLQDPHGPVHSLLGGIYGCDMLLELYDEGYLGSEDYVPGACITLIFTLKDFYRRNYWMPRTDCTVNTTDYRNSDCGFICDTSKKSYFETLLFQQLSHYFPDQSPSGKDAVYTWMCDNAHKIFAGDHLEANSPADPSFWMLHGALERLFHARLMMGGFENEEWATDPINDWVCQLPSCLDPETDTFDYWDTCCYGHYEDDMTMYYNLETGETEYLGPTNGEVLKSIDPRTEDYSASYIYADFDWSHCDIAEDFAALFVPTNA